MSAPSIACTTPRCAPSTSASSRTPGPWACRNGASALKSCTPIPCDTDVGCLRVARPPAPRGACGRARIPLRPFVCGCSLVRSCRAGGGRGLRQRPDGVPGRHRAVHAAAVAARLAPRASCWRSRRSLPALRCPATVSRRSWQRRASTCTACCRCEWRTCRCGPRSSFRGLGKQLVTIEGP